MTATARTSDEALDGERLLAQILGDARDDDAQLRALHGATGAAVALLAAAPAMAQDGPKIDTGDTAWMLTSAALVLFMMPGLALFYGGMSRAKNVLNTFLNVMVCCGVIGVLWVVIGYALVFVWMIPMFLMIDTRNVWAYGIAIFVLTIGLGLSYGPMSAMYAEMFPANVRYSGIGIGYALGAILGGAFAPLIAEALLKEMDIDAYFMEYDDERSGDFRPLRYLPKGKTVVLGLVTTKFGELEDKDALKRRIDEAARYAPMEQLALSPQCGFSSTVHGNNIAVEAQRNKLRLVIDTAREMWGQD